MKKLTGFGTVACSFAVMMWLLTGCATVFKGTSDKVYVSSEPSGAEVYVDGHQMGSTPIKLKLKSDDIHHITIKKEGFKTQTYTVTNHIGVEWVLLDILFDIIPVIVDAVTGAWYVLDEHKINVLLLESSKIKEEVKSPQAQEKSSLRETSYADGSKYVGDIVNGKMHGQGTYIWPSGAKYTGEWKNGKMNGQGTYIWPNGDKYVGGWENNRASGGWLYKADGSKMWVYQDSQRKWIIRSQ